MKDSYIQTVDLTKVYKMKSGQQITALDKVNLQVRENEIFGLVGPNGAGKTTLINILCTLSQPTSGTAYVDGLNIQKDVYQIRNRLGVMFDLGIAYYYLSGYKNLKFWAKIYGIKDYKEKITKIAQDLDLSKWLNEAVAYYSLGMMLKISLARIVLVDPQIWILDEPTRGMDISAVHNTVELLKTKKKEKTIIITSHDLNIMEKLCDRIAIINRGKIIATDTQERLKDMMNEHIRIDLSIQNRKKELISELKSENFVTEIVDTNLGVTVHIINRDSYSRFLSITGKYPITKFDEKEPTLEDMFFKYTKQATKVE